MAEAAVRAALAGYDLTSELRYRTRTWVSYIPPVYTGPVPVQVAVYTMNRILELHYITH